MKLFTDENSGSNEGELGYSSNIIVSIAIIVKGRKQKMKRKRQRREKRRERERRRQGWMGKVTRMHEHDQFEEEVGLNNMAGFVGQSSPVSIGTS